MCAAGGWVGEQGGWVGRCIHRQLIGTHQPQHRQESSVISLSGDAAVVQKHSKTNMANSWLRELYNCCYCLLSMSGHCPTKFRNITILGIFSVTHKFQTTLQCYTLRNKQTISMAYCFCARTGSIIPPGHPRNRSDLCAGLDPEI